MIILKKEVGTISETNSYPTDFRCVKEKPLEQAHLIKSSHPHHSGKNNFKAPFTITKTTKNDETYTSHITFKSPSTFSRNTRQKRRALNNGNFQDAFTRAATHYFDSTDKKESEFTTAQNYLSPQSRLAVEGNQVTLTKRGLSRLEQVVYRFFRPAVYREWKYQNQNTIQQYQGFLIRECGWEKIERIQKTFGFSLETMKQNGEPLLPVHIYYFNIGMNDIEMRDVSAFATKVHQAFKQDHNPNQKALDSFQTTLAGFSHREIRGLLTLVENPESVTLGELAKHFDGLQASDDLMTVSSTVFNNCVKTVTTQKSDWDRSYLGRKFEAPIKGSYNKEIDDSETLRPWVDMQELAQVHHSIKNFPSADTRAPKVFKEYLAKVAAKKHLMRSYADGSEWRVGSIIPSPFKDGNGNTIWYRVEQGVDSGHGKLWYEFAPAHPEYNKKYPVYRVLRDTCRQQYAQRSGPTLSRDLATNAGYKYSDTTDVEDREFFDRFTLPVWMAHLYSAIKNNTDLKTTTDEFLIEIERRLGNRELDQAQKEKLKHAVEKFKVASDHYFRSEQTPEQRNSYILTLKHYADQSDLQKLNDLLEGKKPRPVGSVGNSLGGFDAQYDVIKHTALRHRIPITNLSVYSHSTLKIKEDDNQIFTTFMKDKKELMKELGASLEIDHIAEKGDIVSMFGQDRTFLGEGLENEFPVTFRVFETVESSTHDQIQKLSTHIRRVEALEEEKDIKWCSYTIPSYRTFSNQKRIAGRSLDWWHSVGADSLGLFSLSDLIWRHHRAFKGKVSRISSEHLNDKLTVKRKQGHTFTRVRSGSPFSERPEYQKSSARALYKRFAIST